MRPAKTEESSRVAPRAVCGSIGWEYLEGRGGLVGRAAVFTVAAGLTDGVELRAEGAYLWLDGGSDPRAGAPRGPAQGWGDPLVAMRARIAEPSGERPGAEFALAVKLPSGDHATGLGTEETDMLAFVHLYRDWASVSLHANVGATVVGLPERPHQQEDSFYYAFAAETALGGGVTFLAEAFAEHLRNLRRNPYAALEDYEMAGQAALRWRRGRATWDIGAFTPLRDRDAGWGVTAGVSWSTKGGETR